MFKFHCLWLKIRLRKTINLVNLTGGWTYTDRALTLAKTELFQPSNGARKGVTKVSSCNVGDLDTVEPQLIGLLKTQVKLYPNFTSLPFD